LLIAAAPGAPKTRLVTANIREDWEARDPLTTGFSRPRDVAPRIA